MREHLKLIESEQERLNEISSTLIEESMFPYYGNYLDDLNIPGEYGERIDALVQESMDRELSLRTDVDEIIMSYGGRTITAGQNFRNVYETLNSYDEVLEKSGGRPLWITALEAFLVSMYHGVNQKIHIPIDKLKNNVDEFAQGNMLVQGFDTNPIW